VARGQLDPRAALEMVRVHNRFVREDASPSGTGALKKIERLVERYIGESWTMRKLERYVARLEAKGGLAEPANGELDDTEEQLIREPPRGQKAGKHDRGEALPAVPGPVLERKGDHLVLDVGRIERRELKPEERESLITLFEDLLFKTRRS